MPLAIVGYPGGRGAKYLPTQAHVERAERKWVPLKNKCGWMCWGDDIVVADTADIPSWPERYDAMGAGPLAAGAAAPSYEAAAWGPVPGAVNRPCARFASGSSESMVNAALAACEEAIVWYEEVATIPARNTVIAWGSTTTAGQEVQFYRASNDSMVRVNGADVTVDGGNQGQTEQQMAHIVRTAPTLSYTDRVLHESDTAISASTPDEFRVGAVNIAGSITDYGNVRIRGIWCRHPDAEPLTLDELKEIFQWSLGAHAQEPYYSDDTEFIAIVEAGQSNGTGFATESSVADLPLAEVRSWPRAIDGTPVDPTALMDLQIRDGTTDRHGSWAYVRPGDFGSYPVHVAYCGQGGTTANAWANTGTRGIWSSQPNSEMLRVAHEFFPRMGGTPITHILWAQGETDAINNTASGSFVGSIATIFSRFRAQYGASTPIHVATMSESITGGGMVLANLQRINQCLRNICDPGHDDYIAGCYLVEMTALHPDGAVTEIQGDGLHYTGVGYSRMWQRQKASIQALL